MEELPSPRIVEASSISLDLEDGSPPLEFSREIISGLTNIALRNQISYPEALMQTIATEKFLLDLEADGYRFILKKADGEMCYLERGRV